MNRHASGGKSPMKLFLVPGTEKSHQNPKAGKFDPEQAV